jgi:hypothetical protein
MSKILPALELAKLVPRVDFNPPQLRKEILMHGMKVDWEMASFCACQQRLTVSSSLVTMTADTKEKRSDCPNCKGNGWVHHSKQEIPALVMSASREPERFANYGIHARGMAKITTLPEHLVSFMDRFTLKDSVMTYSETREHKTQTEGVRYPIINRTFKVGTVGNQTVPNSVTIGVLHCNVTDVEGRIITVGGVPLVLAEGTDFTVSSGKMDWTIGAVANSPNPSATFTAPDTIVRGDGGSWITDGFSAGSQITTANATLAANNGTRYIESLTATTIILRTIDTVTTSVDPTATFTGGTAPVVGAKYSLQYYCHPVYICKSNPYTYRDTFIQEKTANPSFSSLPVLSECWLEWLGDESGSQGI